MQSFENMYDGLLHVNNDADGGVEIEREAYREFLSSGVPNMIDVNAELLNGFFLQSNEWTEKCLKTNYYGTKAVTEALLPLLQLSDSAKIVNVSSFFGQLSLVTSQAISNEKVKEELNNIESLTEEQIGKMLVQFVKDYKENKVKDNDWPLSVSGYKIS
ncbi:hypothetical protein Syun_025753 [Stephania yunnanensis]|uniref:Uncharacterized protein n=1 Tax=Stephania yunnanensis TaxID=152371 RepID=A0AAP0EZD8_9MAGN